MRDAIGGTMSITIIIVFLVLINGYLAFSVNYTKAFRVKNRVISTIEQNEGYTEHAKEEIRDYLKQVSYVVPVDYTSKVESDGYTCNDGYCIKVNVAGNTSPNETYQGTYYSVVTFINIDIPVLNKILPLVNAFQIKGETKTIYSSGTNTELQS